MCVITVAFIYRNFVIWSSLKGGLKNNDMNARMYCRIMQYSGFYPGSIIYVAQMSSDIKESCPVQHAWCLHVVVSIRDWTRTNGNGLPENIQWQHL